MKKHDGKVTIFEAENFGKTFDFRGGDGEFFMFVFDEESASYHFIGNNLEDAFYGQLSDDDLNELINSANNSLAYRKLVRRSK